MENQPKPSDVEKSVHGLVSAVLGAGGNPFPLDLHDETLTVFVATHEAPLGRGRWTWWSSRRQRAAD